MSFPKKLFDPLREHLRSIDNIITNIENKVNVLSDSSLLQQELEERIQDISNLNHVIDEQECEIRWLKKKLKENIINE